MVNRFCVAFLLLASGLCFAQQTCAINPATLTGTGRVVYDNRQLQCATWRITYFSDGFSALSIELDGAPDNNGVAGSWAAIAGTSVCTLTGTNPNTAATSATTVFANCYFPWISINLSSVTGSGSIVAREIGRAS